MPNVYLGTTAITKAELGTTDVTKIYLGTNLIWPTVTKYSFVEPFNTAGDLDAYADWVAPPGTNSVRLTVTSGALITTTSTTAGNRELYGMHTTECNTDLNEVTATIASRAPTNYDAKIILHANSTYLNHVCLIPSTFASVYGINTVIGGVRTQRTAISGWATGQVISLKATFNGTNYVYTAYRNGVSVGSWTDTGNLMPHGPGNRYSGLMETFNRSGITSASSCGFDNWSIEDS